MKTLDHSLERIYAQLCYGNCGMAIVELETYLAAWPDGKTAEALRVIKEEYSLMADYWRKGVVDEQRQQLYQRLLQQVYQLFANIAVYRRLQASSFLTGLYQGARQQSYDRSLSAIRGEMENFVSEIAMLDFEPVNKRDEKSRMLYKAHQQHMNSLFNFIVTSRMWSEGVGSGFTDLLLSPTVDSNDQQLIVAAIMLALMSQFDMVKFRLLTDVYRQSQDEHVRQRALVGWVFSLDRHLLNVYPEQKAIIDEMLQSDEVCQELTELQMQLILTLNAEKDNDIISREIMPDLIKNNSFQITRNGIEETEEDSLEEILHPDIAEQRMEKLEASMQRIIDMQKQGVDVYFAGFAQMKRYPFFYDISNWFVPFFMQHPDVAQFVERMECLRFVELILTKGPFCNSDKYSFLIAANDVLSRFPASMREVMMNNEASLGEMEIGENQTAAYLRRIYLMDIYRFFRLFPNRNAMNNPFEGNHSDDDILNVFESELFMQTPLDGYKASIVRMMKKHHFDKMARGVLSTFPESMRDAQYYIWTGSYEKALEIEPDNVRALAGAARWQFSRGNYAQADDYYDRLLLLQPDKVSYKLNKAVCLVKMEDNEEALKLLYQLDYEHAEDANIQRVFAWALTCDGKLEQAEKVFVQLLAEHHATGEDYLNYGYCLWLMNRIDDAAANFRKYIEMTPAEQRNDPLFDFWWLKKRGVDIIQYRMMETLVQS